jgi:hypothetical protein
MKTIYSILILLCVTIVASAKVDLVTLPAKDITQLTA